MYGCNSTESSTEKDSTFTSPFTIKIEYDTDKSHAPALQSFVHGTCLGENGHQYWLLMGGRTNSDGGDGGLHQAADNSQITDGNDSLVKATNEDYAYYSFPMKSFNQTIYLYDVDSDTIVSHIKMETVIKWCSNIASLAKIPFTSSALVNTNALARQYGNTLYLVGGYGPSDITQNPVTGDTVQYETSAFYLQIDIPSLANYMMGTGGIPLVKVGYNDSIRSTGGELFKIGETLYVAGGQHYREVDSLIGDGQDLVPFDQKLIYLTSVVPFTTSETLIPGWVNVSINRDNIITDLPHLDSLDTPFADSTSVFRRRDVVVAPTFIRDENHAGFVFHGGVFKFTKSAKDPGAGPFEAWDNALIIQPDNTPRWDTSNLTALYNSYNVYSCPNFVGIENDSVYSFLMGGIGDGVANFWVSGFTHSNTTVAQPIVDPAAMVTDVDKNGFNPDGTDNRFYGAEAVFIYDHTSPLVFHKNNAEILDLAATLPKSGDSIVVGYIYGGIEADTPNPGGYQGGYTRASNKIFRVTLTRN